jgi:hypothetical protein
MKHRCYGCGVEKDMNVLESSPWAKEDHLTDQPIPPLSVLEIEPDADDADWRIGVVCHECFHKLSPDMWISESCWKRIDPRVPLTDLPFNTDPEGMDEIVKKWDAASYPVK